MTVTEKDFLELLGLVQKMAQRIEALETERDDGRQRLMKMGIVVHEAQPPMIDRGNGIDGKSIAKASYDELEQIRRRFE